MAFGFLRRYISGAWPMSGLFLLLLFSLFLMSEATENSDRFGQLYSYLLLLNTFGLFVLIMLISANLYRLIVQLKARQAGARLTARMVIVFVSLSVLPVLIVYFFSIKIMQRGIDSWFDVKIEQALADSLELSQSALDLRMRERLKETEKLAFELSQVPASLVTLTLGDLRSDINASELTLFEQSGRIIASSSSDPIAIVPHPLGENALLRAKSGAAYMGLEPIGNIGLHVRVVVKVPTSGAVRDNKILQALYPIAERMSQLADSVEAAFAGYKELSYLRGTIKVSFTLTLSLVLLLSLLSAVWAAFFSAQRLVAPIRELADGTKAVADGDYDMQITATARDELGFLVRSFNVMTKRLGQARDQADHSQQQVESQRAYLEAVLGHLSSGVFVVSRDLQLRTSNAAACQVLGVDLNKYVAHNISELSHAHEYLIPLVENIKKHVDDQRDWREEIELARVSGRQVLLCRGTNLPGSHDTGGLVLVFDDITTLIQAQRDAAWAEVARRLAHEIKNPLTPIQLSAERLRRKYLPSMSEEQGQLLDRSTHTIVQQVKALKDMVNDFSEYAKASKIALQCIDLNALVKDIMELYRAAANGPIIELQLEEGIPWVEVDAIKIRQIMHNLVKNSLEAMGADSQGHLIVSTKYQVEDAQAYVVLSVGDNGPGFAIEKFGEIFQPYVTNKLRGTGLGLAIVKKIIDEHGGKIKAENTQQHGAIVTVSLPVRHQADGSGQIKIKGI